MTKGFKKRLCELTKLSYSDDRFWDNNIIKILIKTMWAINREGKYVIIINADDTRVITKGKGSESDYCTYFRYKEHNNSEQDALAAALVYIDNQNEE